MIYLDFILQEDFDNWCWVSYRRCDPRLRSTTDRVRLYRGFTWDNTFLLRGRWSPMPAKTGALNPDSASSSANFKKVTVSRNRNFFMWCSSVKSRVKSSNPYRFRAVKTGSVRVHQKKSNWVFFCRKITVDHYKPLIHPRPFSFAARRHGLPQKRAL